MGFSFSLPQNDLRTNMEAAKKLGLTTDIKVQNNKINSTSGNLFKHSKYSYDNKENLDKLDQESLKNYANNATSSAKEFNSSFNKKEKPGINLINGAIARDKAAKVGSFDDSAAKEAGKVNGKMDKLLKDSPFSSVQSYDTNPDSFIGQDKLPSLENVQSKDQIAEYLSNNPDILNSFGISPENYNKDTQEVTIGDKTYKLDIGSNGSNDVIRLTSGNDVVDMQTKNDSIQSDGFKLLDKQNVDKSGHDQLTNIEGHEPIQDSTKVSDLLNSNEKLQKALGIEGIQLADDKSGTGAITDGKGNYFKLYQDSENKSFKLVKTQVNSSEDKNTTEVYNIDPKLLEE